MVECAFRQQVEQHFQGSGDGGLVHRRGDYQPVGPRHLLHQIEDAWAVEACVEQVLGGKVAQLVARHLHATAVQPAPGAFQQHSRTGANAGASGDGDNEHDFYPSRGHRIRVKKMAGEPAVTPARG
ncbi:hypothetical protein D9M70_605170 [compost metagenome]